MMIMLTNKARLNIVVSILGGSILGALIAYASMSWLRLWWICVAVLVCSLLVGMISKANSIFSAHAIITASYGAYCLILPMQFGLRGCGCSGWVLGEYMTICIAGLVGLQLGYYVPWFQKPQSIQPKSPDDSKDGWTCAVSSSGIIRLAIIFALAIFMRCYYVIRIGGIGQFFSMGYGGSRALSYGDLGFLGLGEDWLMLTICVTVEREMLLKREECDVTVWGRIRRFAVFFLLVVWTYVRLCTGGRGQVFRMVLGLLIAQEIMDGRRSRILRIVSVLAAYAFFAMYGHFRNFLAGGTLTDVMHAMRSDGTFEMLKPTSYGEFINPALALVELIEYQTPRLWGLSYLRIPYIFVPRFLAPNRPPTLGGWRVATFYPSLWERGGGMGFLTVAEGWLNFGLIGAVVHMCLFGVMARYLDAKMAKTSANENLASIAVCSITIPYLAFAGMRIDSAAMLKSFILGYGLPLIFLFGKKGMITRSVQ